MSAADPHGPLLVCWDDSEAAGRALDHAAALLGGGRSAVVLFAYVPTEADRGVFGGRSRPDAAVMHAGDAEDVVTRGVDAAREAGLDAEPLLVAAEQRTAHVIAEAAEDRDAPLIVMGQRERSALGTLVLGSVARELLEAQHRPVLLVGPDGLSRPGR